MSHQTNLTKLGKEVELPKFNPDTTLPLIVVAFFSIVLVIYTLLLIFLCGTRALQTTPQKEERPDSTTEMQMVNLHPSCHRRGPDDPERILASQRQTYFACYVREGDNKNADGHSDNEDESHRKSAHTHPGAKSYNEVFSNGMNIPMNPQVVSSHHCNTLKTGSRKQSDASTSFANLPPYLHPGFSDSGKFHRTMGLKKLDLTN